MSAADRDDAMRIAEAAELAELRLMLHRARFLVGHQGTPTHVMRDLAGMGIKADERAEQLEAELSSLQGACRRICTRGRNRGSFNGWTETETVDELLNVIGPMLPEATL